MRWRAVDKFVWRNLSSKRRGLIMTLSLLVTSLFLAFGVSECIAHIPQGGIAEELSGFSQKQEDSQEYTMVSAEEDGFANVEEGSGESELEASSESVVGPFKTHCVEEGPSSSTHFRYNHCCAPIDRWYFECKPGYFRSEASSESVVGPFKTHCVEEGPSSSTHFRYNHCCAPIDRWYFECKPGYF